MNNNGQYQGADIEIWQTLADRMNIKIDYQSASLQDCEEMLKTGALDVFPSLLRNPVRENYYHFLEPPFRTKLKYAFYVPKGKQFTIVNYDDLAGKKIGVPEGKNRFQPFDGDSRIEKDFEGSLSDSFSKLKEGALDAVLTNDWAGDYFLLQSGWIDQFEKACYSHSEYQPCYLVMSKQSKYIHRVKDFENTLKEMLDDGTVRRIVNRYIPNWYDYFQPANLEEVGMNPERVANIILLAEKWIRDDAVIGAVLLVLRHNQVVFHEAVGWNDRERNIPMQTNSIGLLGSMTKPLTGTAILMLMEEGKLSLHDRVSKYIPSFNNPKSDKVTLFQLMTHTAGFSWENFEEEYARFPSLAEAVDWVGQKGTAFDAGTKFLYTSYGYSILGRIVEIVSGMPSQEFIQKRILEPLEMKDSFCLYNSNNPLSPKVASRYEGSPGNWRKVWDNTQPSEISFFTSATGFYSTAIDYAKFMSMFLGNGRYQAKRFLAPSMIRLALSDQSSYVFDVNDLRKQGGPFEYNRLWGLNFWIFTDRYGSMRTPISPGSFAIYGITGSFAFADPHRDLIGILLTQTRVSQPDIFIPFTNTVYSAIEK